ncbi:MAG: UvrD-helicase domain-containing protein [Chlamydiia bacterium]|nr:UvrD-helicase domain-containing protein [Chlamydiia bacterium]
MRPFDCLLEQCPIFGSHLLEASAGTGKTFAIEHVFVRLLLESGETPIEVEQILIVTFTRASTRDLKRRLRNNLEEALQRLRAQNREWGYLVPHFGSKTAEQRLRDAIDGFALAQIFTIHGFCYRMLQEFAFEARLGFALPDPDHTGERSEKRLGRVKKFLECELEADLLCIEQISFLLKTIDSFDELGRKLLKQSGSVTKGPSLSFSEAFRQYQIGLSHWKGGSVQEERLLEDFFSLSEGHKAAVKGDFKEQVKALAQGLADPSNPLHFRMLLKHQGTLFAYLSPSNRKVRAQTPHDLHYPSFFSWADHMFSALIQQAMDRKGILNCLQKAWEVIEKEEFSEEALINPDAMLVRMKQALSLAPFALRVKEKYKAVLIDEFQDTDTLQWEIFQTLFLQNRESSALRALYLVGDPKQSIYRFRSADIYTYLSAKELLGVEAQFSLDTNYRSSPELVSALNALFARSWLVLPKKNQMLLSPAVKAGCEAQEVLPPDGKGALHVLLEKGQSDAFETTLLPFAVSEIERLSPLSLSMAILVKDRHQVERALRLLRARRIPAMAKSHTPLGQTAGFRLVKELFENLSDTRKPSLQRSVDAGPFAEVTRLMEIQSFAREDLIACCRQVLSSVIDPAWALDVRQAVEEILSWAARSAFSVEALLQFLQAFEERPADEGARRYGEEDTDAVQVLTLHASKGLEFDLVFALGLTARSPEAEEEGEEFNAEKLRQLYVAMTRAKLRLYIPLLMGKSAASRGAPSPMELFSDILEEQEGPLLPFLEKLAKTETISFEALPDRVLLPPVQRVKKECKAPKEPLLVPKAIPQYIQSFTSLSAHAQPESFIPSEPMQDLLSRHTIPKGIETGIAIHQIFETLFQSPTPIWRDRSVVEALVSASLTASLLLPWQAPIQEMVWAALQRPLFCHDKPFSLSHLEPNQLQTEVPFLFSRSPHYVKGFIDLVFIHKEKYYFVDWKTNWLGSSDESYQFLQEAMSQHDYWFQAAIYAEALRRHVKRFYTEPFEEIFGGALYFFLRGDAVCSFIPEPYAG